MSLLPFLFSAFALLAGALFITIPQSLHLHQEWEKSQKYTIFSTLITVSGLTILLFLFAYRILLDISLRYLSEVLTDSSISVKLYVIPFSVLIIFALVVHATSTYSLKFFRKWRATQKPLCFSFSILLGTLSVFCFSFIYKYISGFY